MVCAGLGKVGKGSWGCVLFLIYNLKQIYAINTSLMDLGGTTLSS